MRSIRIVVCLLVASCLPTVCRAQEEPATLPATRPAAIEPLTRSRARAILADTDAIGEDVMRQIRTLRNPLEAAVIEDISDVMSHASEWRWYSRDHGILLAIPVRERLGILADVNGEQVLADVVRRLINQRGLGNPPVRVVLIEPEEPARVVSPAAWQASVSPAFVGAVPAACACP
jgi:hypothetical protein